MLNKTVGGVFPGKQPEDIFSNSSVPQVKQKADVGVIVGRFQVDELHDGHISLINQIVNNHRKVIVFLGLSPCKCTVRNPLDFESRKKMILEKFPDIIVLYIMDQYSDISWSDNLDNQIKIISGPKQTVILYGSRDSFIKYYSGKYETEELEQTIFTSGTEIRKKISNLVAGSPEFRKGVIWAVNNQWPKCFPTVDIAIIGRKYNTLSVMLGKRKGEPKYRFVGGFVNPGETLESAALREVIEETCLSLKGLRYLKSFVIDDWRYRSEADKITSSLFIGEYDGDLPQASDDIDELRWFVLAQSLLSVIVDEHKDMMYSLLGEYRVI
ncbi:NUDIX domain-containing protein [Candidatus Dojkabacteria bacterium]|jgi:bifunctional NMN adenylyltransferase/nudix hydrolase|nr:NUDIX domain-containing protein [Candidatus Dojkabacteria bacterium]